jgi:hypothetical protein
MGLVPLLALAAVSSVLAQDYKHYCFANTSFGLSDAALSFTLQRVVLM